MYSRSALMSDMRLEIKHLRDKVASFESGEEYEKIKAEYKAVIREQRGTINGLRAECSSLRLDLKRMRACYFEASEDYKADADKRVRRAEKDLEKAIMEKLDLVDGIYELKEEIKKLKDENRKLLAEKKELEEKLAGLTAVKNHDYTNSSISSSMSPNHKKIRNSRVRTGRKPGGQAGHPHHERKKRVPDRTIDIPAEEYLKDRRLYRPTGNTVRKQLVILHTVVETVEYTTPEYICIRTGRKVHSKFPDQVKDEMNYDGTVKALAFLLNNWCNVSIGKTGEFIKALTGGRIDLSEGMITNLSKQFSKKTEKDRMEIFQKLVASPTMHVDFTFGRMDGKQAAVIICASGDNVLYQGREKKGDEGVAGSPAQYYNGFMINDHEAALVKIKCKGHQECLSHVNRYLQDSIEIESGMEWNKRMLDWSHKAIHYWKDIRKGKAEYNEGATTDKIKKFMQILEKAKEEYEEHPPGKYYKDGFNLFSRVMEKPEDYILFLRDPEVEPTNNLAERHARQFKRKAHQVMTFRSLNGVCYYCDGLSVIRTIRSEGKDIYKEVAERFNHAVT